MDDVAKRVANLSAAKRALLELKLNQSSLKDQAAIVPEPAAPDLSLKDISRRLEKLSPAKQALLQLRLNETKPSEANDSGHAPPIVSNVVIAQKVANLSPAKRALLKFRLADSQPGSPDHSVDLVADSPPLPEARPELPQPESGIVQDPDDSVSPDQLLGRFANLSAAKQALVELRLGGQGIDLPDTQEEHPPLITPDFESDAVDQPTEPLLPESAADADEANWLADLSLEEPDVPDWLAEASEDSDQGDVSSAPLVVDELSGVEQSQSSDWLAEIETTSTTETKEDYAPEAEPEELTDILNFDEEPAIPDWLADGGGEGLPPETPSSDASPLNRPGLSSWFKEDSVPAFDEQPATKEDAAPALDEQPPAGEQPQPIAAEKSTPSGNVSGWLEALSPTDETVTEDAESKTAEATGMLAGLSTLLPAEKVPISVPERLGKDDDLAVAAQEFYKIATQVPQAVTLPAQITGREKVVGQTIRALLYLLFVALVAIPLYPGAQKVDGETNITVPWTEPVGDSHEVLDSQRRQLISEQLGIIDLQQPEAVALVSFDYSTATQGEMQPLADAVIGRLKGQGMRIIAVSLEQEGAVIAQQTLEEMLTERKEQYGVDAVNLGYIPGQVAAIRTLVTKQNALSNIADFKQGLKFDAPERSTWSSINNLSQANIIVTLADNPTTARWWVEQLEMAPQTDGDPQFLLAATSAGAGPFLQPYRDSNQLDGLISGINGAAAIEAGRNTFGSAREMLDSQSIAHLIIVILIAVGTIVGWMPSVTAEPAQPEPKEEEAPDATPEA